MTLTLATLPYAGFSAQDLLGARALVERAKASVGEKAAKTETVTPEQSKRDAFAKEVTAYRKGCTALSPEEAAKQWLALVDGVLDLPRDASRGYSSYSQFDAFSNMDREIDDTDLSLRLIISIVPGPSAWDALDKAVGERTGSTQKAKRINAVLRILMDLLHERLADVDGSVTALKESIGKNANPFGMNYGSNADQRMIPLKTAIRETVGFGSKEEIVASFKETLDSAGKSKQRQTQLKVPDLCQLTTEAEARELLKRVILLDGVQPQVASGGKTLKLLKTVLLEEMENTKQPLWALVSSPKDTALFEALDQQFPQTKEPKATTQGSPFMRNNSYGSGYGSQHARKQASSNYLIGLISAGRIDDALKIAKANEPSGGAVYSNGGFSRGLQGSVGPNMFRFVDQLLTDDPKSGWWPLYMSTALMTQQSDAALARVSKVLEDTTLETPLRLTLLKGKSSLDLSLGNIEAGIASLLEICDIELNETATNNETRSQFGRGASQQLTQMGLLLKRPKLLDRGIALTTEITKKSQQQQRYGGNSWYQYSGLVELLIKAERYAEAEGLVLKGIEATLKAKSIQTAQSGMSSFSHGQMPINLSAQLTVLIRLYDKLGRTDDIWYLLQEVPWWGTPILPLNNKHLVVPTAKALAASDRSDEAVQLLKRFLLSRSVSDEAYELLVSLDPPDLLDWLDQMYARDKFEERPLIWKAVVLKNKGQLDAAEAAVRHALKVDPTDGETQAGQRVIAYGILGDILEAKGKGEDATFFRNVVSSVRKAEEGDTFSEAGLTSKSISLYEQAEQDFVDAYCVQWRLAERLHTLGRYEEAEKHYEIAFERMPEQFGRVASFCFGCNGVFQKEHSRSVAERILSRLVKTHPDNPQIHFLIGQLYQAKRENSEAYEHFRKAVELDPQYLDAWEKLYSLSRQLFLPKSESDTMVVHALTLDPLQRHFGSGIESMGKIRALWSVMEKNQDLAIDSETVSIELSATKADMDAMLAKMGPAASKALLQSQRQNRYNYGGSINPRRPGFMLSNHKIVTQLLSILSQQ